MAGYSENLTSKKHFIFLCIKKRNLDIVQTRGTLLHLRAWVHECLLIEQMDLYGTYLKTLPYQPLLY